MIDIIASVAATTRQHAEGMVKIEEDLERYKRVIADVGVSTVLELGTFSGKSAAWFAERPGVQRVVTVDVNPQLDDATLDRWGRKVDWLRGSSTHAAVVSWIYDAIPEIDLLILDSDHSRPHVLHEMKLYAGLVRPGGAMVVEDTILHWMDACERAHYDGDPFQAVGDWLSSDEGDKWEHWDDVNEMFDVSMHIDGWLRRIR